MSKYTKLPIMLFSIEIVLFIVKLYGYASNSFSENTQISITTVIISLSFIYFIFLYKKPKESLLIVPTLQKSNEDKK